MPPDLAGERLDRVLVALLSGEPEPPTRSRLKGLIEGGAVTLDGLAVTMPSLVVRAGQALSLAISAPVAAEPKPQAIPLAIVYEDADLVVIDKPAGLVVHPGAGTPDGTLVNALLAHCGAGLSGIGGVLRPGIVHRLDKDTSGLLVVAKTDRAHQGLARQFADHGRTGPLERAYTALAWGSPPARATVETGIERSKAHRERMAAVAVGRGRLAITHLRRIDTYGDSAQPGAVLASEVECRLETGRTHQIRVHMAHLGHPLLGDAAYGAAFRTKANRLGVEAREALDRLGRQALHARLLGFEHPVSGRHLRFESELPPDLEALRQRLKSP